MPGTEKLLSEEVRAAEGIVRALEGAGIDMIFGIQGGNMGRLYDALYDHQDSIRAVLVRHEQLASVMAEVYGRLTGKPGVCTGQGIFMLANAFLGTLEAHFGASPMLFLSELSDGAPFTLHAPYQSGTGDYGAADTARALAAVTKHTTVARLPAEAVQATQFGIKHALSGERGPVGVLYHSNCFTSGNIDPEARPFLYPTEHYLPEPQPGDPAAVAAAARLLEEAERPVVVAGNGVRISQAFDELAALAEKLAIPVATTASGKGVYAETGPWALGPCGNFGQPAANAFIGQADLVLAVGTRLGQTDTANQNPALIDPRRQTLVQIDVEPKNASWSFPCDQTVIGDARLVLAQLTQEVSAPAADTRAARETALAETRSREGFFDHPLKQSDDAPVMPQRLLAELHEAIDDDAMVCLDAGENRLFSVHHFQTKGANTLLMPGIGAMGYAIPAALAAKLVFPERQAIALSGDGGFGMAMNGMMTAIDEDIPIVSVVMNNSALGWVRHGQGNRTIASAFAEMNFAEMARVMGCHGVRVEKPGDLAAGLREALDCGRPAVVDVVTSFEPNFRDVTSPLTQG
jgi:acetolactate synthase-1/2/3 large subunit